MDILSKFLKQVGPNKQVGWRKKAVNIKQVGLASRLTISGIPENSA